MVPCEDCSPNKCLLNHSSGGHSRPPLCMEFLPPPKSSSQALQFRIITSCVVPETLPQGLQDQNYFHNNCQTCNGVAAAETTWPTEFQIFAIWPLMEKLRQSFKKWCLYFFLNDTKDVAFCFKIYLLLKKKMKFVLKTLRNLQTKSWKKNWYIPPGGYITALLSWFKILLWDSPGLPTKAKSPSVSKETTNQAGRG